MIYCHHYLISHETSIRKSRDLYQEPANFSWKGQDCKCCLCRQCVIMVANYWTLPFEFESSYRRYVMEWVRLCPNKMLFTKQMLARLPNKGCSLPSPLTAFQMYPECVNLFLTHLLPSPSYFKVSTTMLPQLLCLKPTHKGKSIGRSI